MNRRTWLGRALAAALVIAPWSVLAETNFPTRSVSVVVGFPAGSATDVAARQVAERMGQELGQPFVVENRPGASSNLAANAVAGATPDGYTLFVGTIANAINASLQPDVSADLNRDFDPIGMIGSVPNLLVAHPSVNVNSVQGLIDVAKKDPGGITYASSGVGTSPHLSGELFSMMAGVSMLHVPYRGSSAAMSDLLSGEVKVMFSPASTVLAHIRSGKLIGLAATSAQRTQIAPDLPTIDELGLKGFETAVWFGLVVPKQTPPAVRQRLEQTLAKVLAAPDLREGFQQRGIEVVDAVGEVFGNYIRSENAKWAKVVRDAKVKPQ